jgi:hypothetical protein
MYLKLRSTSRYTVSDVYQPAIFCTLLMACYRCNSHLQLASFKLFEIICTFFFSMLIKLILNPRMA